jgi:hypothetical protein
LRHAKEIIELLLKGCQPLTTNDLGRARHLPEAHRPAGGEADLQAWEWRYLSQERRSDDLAELCR